MRNLKLQSAMEYLMTYGWAILIIAVVMVALFSLGILGGSPLSTTCLPQSGYQCSSPVLSHTTGNLIVTIGQTSGQNWATANVYFVPQGTTTASGVPTSITNYPANGNYLSSGLSSGSTLSITVPTVNALVNVGTSASGTIWAAYTIQGSATQYYAQVATATLKAV